MPRLYQYWLKEFLKLFFTIQFIIIVLFVVIEYLSMLDKFLSSDISLFNALWFVFLEVPFMFVQVMPAGILLANIIIFSLMNKNNELLALRSSGVNTYSILKPSIFSSFLIMIAMFAMSEIIVPTAMTKAHDIESNFIKHKKNIVMDKENIWMRSGKKIVHFSYYNPANKSVSGITVLSMGKNFKPILRIDAMTGYYEKERWIFEDGIEQIYNQRTGDYDIRNYRQTELSLDFKPKDIGQLIKKSEEMSFRELKSYVNKIENEGYDATAYLVDLHGKMAFPFICIIMALAGAATGMKPFAKDSIPKAVTLGIVIAFFYWFFYGIGMSLGYGKFLPPLIAAWVSNFFFAAILFYIAQ